MILTLFFYELVLVVLAWLFLSALVAVELIARVPGVLGRGVGHAGHRPGL